MPKSSKRHALYMPKISMRTNQTIHSSGLLHPLFLYQMANEVTIWQPNSFSIPP